MKVALIHGSSQKNKNKLLYDLLEDNTEGIELINLGCFEDEIGKYSYVDIALQICMLINSKAIDFCVTGCSSGQGMALACNVMPGLLCGYCPRPEDAFLFGRINDGNVMSMPLGLNYGWCSELNIGNTINSMFCEKFGMGYPPKDAQRKRKDTELLKKLNEKSKVGVLSLIHELDEAMVDGLLSRRSVVDYIIENGKSADIVEWFRKHKKEY